MASVQGIVLQWPEIWILTAALTEWTTLSMWRNRRLLASLPVPPLTSPFLSEIKENLVSRQTGIRGNGAQSYNFAFQQSSHNWAQVDEKLHPLAWPSGPSRPQASRSQAFRTIPPHKEAQGALWLISITTSGHSRLSEGRGVNRNAHNMKLFLESPWLSECGQLL